MNILPMPAFYPMTPAAKPLRKIAMDIARTPSTPDGNPQLADAAPEPKEPPLIRREDYRPFPWLVPEIALDFDLGLEATQVTATLTVARNARADVSQIIRLNG